MLNKNDIIDLEITDVTNQGFGVGKYDKIAIFVPQTALGDIISCRIVKVLKNYCYGIVEEMKKTSEHRCDADCNNYKQCGGCVFRHVDYAHECEYKAKFVKDAFERIGGLAPEFEDFFPCENYLNYRGKVQIPVGEKDGKLFAGFYANHSHRIIPADKCLLHISEFDDIIKYIIDFGNKNNVRAYDEKTGRGLLRHIYIRQGRHTKETMVCLVVTNLKKAEIFNSLACSIINKFPNIKSFMLNENSQNTNIILGKKYKTVIGESYITDTMCGKKFEISPASFYQVNTLQAEKLYGFAKDFAGLSGDEILLDLYCGIGTIGISMSDKVKKLIGVEIVESAVKNAEKNAKLNNIDNAEFIVGDAGKVSKILYNRGENPNVIIADPARKGCTAETLEYMVKMNPDKIVMISCNPSTAARDCKILGEFGYKTVKVKGVDLFPRTAHVESVVLMTRKEK